MAGGRPRAREPRRRRVRAWVFVWGKYHVCLGETYRTNAGRGMQSDNSSGRVYSLRQKFLGHVRNLEAIRKFNTEAYLSS